VRPRNLYVSYCRLRLLDTSLAADLIGVWPVSVSQTSPFHTGVGSGGVGSPGVGSDRSICQLWKEARRGTAHTAVNHDRLPEAGRFVP
jgi:hypothetical protein